MKLEHNIIKWNANAFVYSFFIIYDSDENLPFVFFLCSGITLSTGFFSEFLPKKIPEIKKRDGYLIVVLGWLFMTFFGSLPYLINIPKLLTHFLRQCQALLQLVQLF